MNAEDRNDNLIPGYTAKLPGQHVGGAGSAGSADSFGSGVPSGSSDAIESDAAFAAATSVLSAELSSLSEWRGGPTRLWEAALESCGSMPGEDAGGDDFETSFSSTRNSSEVVIRGGLLGWMARHRALSSIVSAAAAVLIAASAWIVGYNRGFSSTEVASLGRGASMATSSPTLAMEGTPPAAVLSRTEESFDSRFATDAMKSPATPETYAVLEREESFRSDALQELPGRFARTDSERTRDFVAAGAARGRAGATVDAAPQAHFSMSAAPSPEFSLQQQRLYLVVAYDPEQVVQDEFERVSQQLIPGESLTVTPIEIADLRSNLPGPAAQQAEHSQWSATFNLRNDRAVQVLQTIEEMGTVVRREVISADLAAELRRIESQLQLQNTLAENFRSVAAERMAEPVQHDVGRRLLSALEPVELTHLDSVELEQYRRVLGRISDLNAQRAAVLLQTNLTHVNVRLVPDSYKTRANEEK